MRQSLFILLTIIFLFPVSLKAQVENVIVETYYISDANDATDTIGGKLEEGSKTYRIYIDMKPGTKLRKIYGDANHALKISSTANFFNNVADGQTFAKDFPKNRYAENTVALDSWLTLGQVTRNAAKTYFGVIKEQDRDGSFIGGVHNDGGSAAIPTGLLANNDPAAGIPLTISDGMDTMVTLPASWADYGIRDISSSVDSTIFGSLKSGSEFISNNAGLQNSGVMGVNPDSNQVLVAQLTTKGDISFELNIEVEEPATPNPRIVQYVAQLANGEVNSDSLILSPYLKYPQSCGCKDPNFLEYSATFACDNASLCKTPVVFGCMDPLSCNYNPEANFSVPSLCCYPGYCNDRDISVVCPSLASGLHRLNLYPNPAQNQLTIQVSTDDHAEASYVIYNSFGRIVMERNIGDVSSVTTHEVNISGLNPGIYMVRLFMGNTSDDKIFMKN